MVLNSIKDRIMNGVHRIRSKRNSIAFVIFGLLANVGFSVTLTAAQDLLEGDGGGESQTISNNMSSSLDLTRNISDTSVESGNTTLMTKYLVCDEIGTGAILMAMMIPELSVRLLLQFSCINISYRLKVILLTNAMAAGFLTLAFADRVVLTFLGAIFNSCVIGLAEQTFIPMTSLYNKEVVNAWSIGVGASSLLGSLSYAGLKSLGLTTSQYMLICLCVPILNAFTYICILQRSDDNNNIENVNDDETTMMISKDVKEKRVPLTYRQKLSLIPSLLKYVLPYTTMFFFVYLINQGLYELMYFNTQWISRESQYRWFNAIYRIGSFTARCLGNYINSRRLWVPTFLLIIITAIFVGHIFERYVPYVWMVMLLIFIEGYINGFSYVSIYLGMTNNLDFLAREYGLGLVSIGGPLGIGVAAMIALPFHDFICSLDLKM